MRNIVLAVIGCSLAFIAHAESWEHLNDIGNKDEQVLFKRRASMLKMKDLRMLLQLKIKNRKRRNGSTWVT